MRFFHALFMAGMSHKANTLGQSNPPETLQALFGYLDSCFRHQRILGNEIFGCLY